jgi:hypothetical protein
MINRPGLTPAPGFYAPLASRQFGRVAISRPPQAEHRSFRPMSGTGSLGSASF